MASINIRIDDELKVRAYRELEKLGVTPSELMRQALQYVAERGQLPFRPVLMTEEDEALIATVRERLADPQRVKVSLDDLKPRIRCAGTEGVAQAGRHRSRAAQEKARGGVGQSAS